MAIYFTSDTHFGHANIIKTCHRPFVSVAAMDETIIANWNERVRPDDTVYHLGDFCFRNTISADEYRGKLNGTIHLVKGNHDQETLNLHASIFASINLILEIEVEGHHIVMCHYPMREWHGAWRKAWHLFGHVHGRLDTEPHGYSLDVGVDSHQYLLWSVEEIATLFRDRENPYASGKRRSVTIPNS